MRLLPKSIHRCHRYPTKFNSGRDIPSLPGGTGRPRERDRAVRGDRLLHVEARRRRAENALHRFRGRIEVSRFVSVLVFAQNGQSTRPMDRRQRNLTGTQPDFSGPDPMGRRLQSLEGAFEHNQCRRNERDHSTLGGWGDLSVAREPETDAPWVSCSAPAASALRASSGRA